MSREQILCQLKDLKRGEDNDVMNDWSCHPIILITDPVVRVTNGENMLLTNWNLVLVFFAVHNATMVILKIKSFSNPSLTYMFWSTRPPLGALKFGGTAVPSMLLRLLFSYLQFPTATFFDFIVANGNIQLRHVA